VCVYIYKLACWYTVSITPLFALPLWLLVEESLGGGGAVDLNFVVERARAKVTYGMQFELTSVGGSNDTCTCTVLDSPRSLKRDSTFPGTGADRAEPGNERRTKMEGRKEAWTNGHQQYLFDCRLRKEMINNLNVDKIPSDEKRS